VFNYSKNTYLFPLCTLQIRKLAKEKEISIE